MTYNVFDWTLNLAQSVMSYYWKMHYQCKSTFNAVYQRSVLYFLLFWMQFFTDGKILVD